MGRHGPGGREEQWEVTGPRAELAQLFEPDDEADGESAPTPGQWPDRPRHRMLGWGYRALVVLLVLIAAVVGFRVAAALQHRDGGEVLVKSSSSSMSSSPSASTVASASSAGPEENDGDEPAQVQVHVVGAVKHPGLYRLKPGTRVDDAVKAAGGALGRADLGAINLAAPVADGTQVRVPVHGETAAPAVGPATSSDPAGSPQPDAGAPVNLNTADATTLQTLPGIGPALSQRLIEWREQHGSFGSGTDLDAVPGIGPAMLAKLEGKVSYG